MPAETRRVYFALWPDTVTAAALAALVQQGYRHCGGRRMREQSLHLTLAFLGEVTATQLDAARAAAARVICPGFDFVLDRIGYWKHNRILWAGCAAVPPPLAELAALLARALAAAGFVLEQRPYAPHVTLLRKAACVDAPPTLAVSVPWSARDFVLVESHAEQEASRYEILARWPLATGMN